MTSPREAELGAALTGLRTRLRDAADAAGRDVNDIELLPVTKFFPAADVIFLRRLGCDAFGESREQEASNKAAEVATQLGGELTERPIRWHMVGRIQRNKAKAVAGWAHTAHSVDSIALLRALGRASVEALADGRREEALRVYVQLSLDGDVQRGGVDARNRDEVDEVCAVADSTDGLTFVGLMAIPPLDSDADEEFGRLAAERERVQTSYQQRLGLSAGMSGDLETAVKHGSTCVRVGTSLMGQRPLTSP
ncbi:alanine racemase [Mycolicibacterium sp. YH-1]|nr:alanine racemase [Mycolicibacterium sp. YH-1]UNB55205.1 alanine racemase [Mycolicibacterium sp. YH-1]